MPLFLTDRDRTSKELMDDPDCDLQLLNNTYSQFSTVNRLLGGWGKIYKKWLFPVLENCDKKPEILDIGCGGGDVLRFLKQLAEKDNLDVGLTGIDLDERAIQFAKQTGDKDSIRFLNISSQKLIEKGNTFDIVISNHLMHHLTENELLTLCKGAEKLTRRLVLFSDIERSDIGYAAFQVFSPIFFRKSFISADGLTSIKRSYRQSELQQLLPESWQVKRQFPFRLLALFNK